MIGAGVLETNAIRGLPADVAALRLATFITGLRVDFATEQAAQQDLWGVLLRNTDLLGQVSREHRLSAADRPDFLVDGRIVVEVKARKARSAECLRQIERYAAHNQVAAIVVVCCGRALALPHEVRGKPVRTIGLGRAWL